VYLNNRQGDLPLFLCDPQHTAKHLRELGHPATVHNDVLGNHCPSRLFSSVCGRTWIVSTILGCLQLQMPEKDAILVMNTRVVELGRLNFITLRSSFPHILAFNFSFSRRRSFLGISPDFQFPAIRKGRLR